MEQQPFKERPQRPSEPIGPVDDARSVPWLVGWSVLGLAGAAATIWALAAGARTELQAATVALVALSIAVVLHHLLVTGDAGELQYEREQRLPGALAEDRVARTLGRRPLLVRAGVAVAALGGLVGLGGIRLFGPRRGEGSAWAPGVAVVTNDGDRLRPEDIAEGGVVTGWPEGSIDVEAAAVMVLRLRDAPQEPTDLAGVVEERLVAYSRICTHAGCPVALYRDRDQALFCPCHQATFDARRAATPTFGPASGPLPQLPLGVDDDGFLVALDDFPVTPGPLGGET